MLRKLPEFNESLKDQTLNAALQQIEKRNYAASLQADGYSRIEKIALACSGKKVYFLQAKPKD